MSSLSATPPTPGSQSVSISASSDIKSATPDIVLLDAETIDVENLTDLIFENIGGHELITIARTDTVNGQELYYNPIKNLSDIQRQYNPKNILSLQQTSDKYFENFSIKLDPLIPSVGGGPDNFNVYMEPLTGDLIVEATGLQSDEQIEIQVSIDGTIYDIQPGA